MPFSSQTSIRIYYELLGKGERVLFIGGTGADLRIKPNIMDGTLCQTFQLLTYDQRGLGQTDKPDSAYTMAQYADDAAELMDELGWPDAHVIGVSFGGMVAQHLALRHPGRVNRLVLCCTSPGGNFSSYPLHELDPPASGDSYNSEAEEARMAKQFAISDTRLDAKWQSEHPDQLSNMIAFARTKVHVDASSAEFRMGARRQLEARSHHEVVEQLGNLKCTTLICAGSFDGLAPPNNQEELLRLLPNATLKWYQGGHLFLLQDKTAWPDIERFLKAAN